MLGVAWRPRLLFHVPRPHLSSDCSLVVCFNTSLLCFHTSPLRDGFRVSFSDLVVQDPVWGVCWELRAAQCHRGDSHASVVLSLLTQRASPRFPCPRGCSRAPLTFVLVTTRSEGTGHLAAPCPLGCVVGPDGSRYRAAHGGCCAGNSPLSVCLPGVRPPCRAWSSW